MLFRNDIYLEKVPVGNEFKLAVIESVVWTAAPLATVFSNGFKTNGAALLSGKGSILIAIVFPLRSVGNVSPVGAFINKSSPGKAGPLLLVPL